MSGTACKLWTASSGSSAQHPRSLESPGRPKWQVVTSGQGPFLHDFWQLLLKRLGRPGETRFLWQLAAHLLPVRGLKTSPSRSPRFSECWWTPRRGRGMPWPFWQIWPPLPQATVVFQDHEVLYMLRVFERMASFRKSLGLAPSDRPQLFPGLIGKALGQA